MGEEGFEQHQYFSRWRLRRAFLFYCLQEPLIYLKLLVNKLAILQLFCLRINWQFSLPEVYWALKLWNDSVLADFLLLWDRRVQFPHHRLQHLTIFYCQHRFLLHLLRLFILQWPLIHFEDFQRVSFDLFIILRVYTCPQVPTLAHLNSCYSKIPCYS